ncbi:MAG: sugar transferase [Planctomycetota bacterium]|nr:sugar transferase [Planctomycetota bacterium]MDA1177233.1 sugar transferase [Planctomycetota bacterium]
MPSSVKNYNTQENATTRLDAVINTHVPTFRCKTYVIERLMGLLFLIIACPVIVMLAVCVRMTSHGPGLYRQIRVGRHGRIFTMLKIRTMTVDAESLTGPQWSRVNDPRITALGRFIRKSHLDELPQLWNVACGDMALMGPRPERPELVHILAEYVPGYLNRLAIQPGITGLAQINLPPDTDVESVRRKLVLDMEYISTATLWLDFRMFVWTILRLVGCPARLATPLLRLSRQVPWSPTGTSSEPLTIEAILAIEEQRQSQLHDVDFPSADEPQDLSEREVSTVGLRSAAEA